jgi:hypothetical protein
MTRPQVDAVRAFNRFFTRRIGVLDESFLGRGRPLAQARLLYEIGKNGADVGSLRTQLGLDSGYLSRMIRCHQFSEACKLGARQGFLRSLPFKNGDVIVRELSTSKGPLELLAEIQIHGRTGGSIE